MKQSTRTSITTSGIFIFTLVFSGVISAAGGNEPGMEEILAEGIPHPPVIIDIKEYKGDRSNPGRAKFLTEGVAYPKTLQPPQNFIGDLAWPSSQQMMAEENVSLAPRKIERNLADARM